MSAYAREYVVEYIRSAWVQYILNCRIPPRVVTFIPFLSVLARGGLP